MSDDNTDPPALVILPERRRGGRPRVSDEPSTPVSTTLPVSDYDRLLQLAKTRRTTLAGALRDMIINRRLK